MFCAEHLSLTTLCSAEATPTGSIRCRPHTRRGGNDDAFEGGFRLWEELIEPHDRQPAGVWRVVR